MRKLETLDNGAAISCPDGMIHHWVGLAFVPGQSCADVLDDSRRLQSPRRLLRSDVEQSKIESRDGDRFRVFLRFRRHKIVTVVLNTEHDVQYFRDSDTRAHSRSSAVRIAQVENPGKRRLRRDRTGDDDGLPVADGDVVADDRKRRRRLRAERSGFADAGYSCWTGLDDRAICNQHPEGVSCLYAGSDAEDSHPQAPQLNHSDRASLVSVSLYFKPPTSIFHSSVLQSTDEYAAAR